MNLSATCHAALEMCSESIASSPGSPLKDRTKGELGDEASESRRSNRVTVTFRFLALYNVHLSTYMNSPNYPRCGIFLLLVALLDTCTDMISRLGIGMSPYIGYVVFVMGGCLFNAENYATSCKRSLLCARMRMHVLYTRTASGNPRFWR